MRDSPKELAAVPHEVSTHVMKSWRSSRKSEIDNWLMCGGLCRKQTPSFVQEEEIPTLGPFTSFTSLEVQMTDSAGFFVWYELITSDVAAAKGFYGRVLGWT